MKLFGLEKSSQVSDFRPKDYKNLAMIYKDREREREKPIDYSLVKVDAICYTLPFIWARFVCEKEGRRMINFKCSAQF